MAELEKNKAEVKQETQAERCSSKMRSERYEYKMPLLLTVRCYRFDLGITSAAGRTATSNA